MDFFDEESRPRFLLQSRSTPNPTPQPTLDHLHKPTLFISLTLSALLLSLSIFYFKSDPFQSLLLWSSLSLLIGPFAPNHLTAGDIRVGQGPVIPPPQTNSPTSHPDPPKRSRIKVHKPDPTLAETGFGFDSIESKKAVKDEKKEQEKEKEVIVMGDGEWSVEDMEVLKKQMVKNPVGMPGRWEAVAGAFGGKYKVESVVKMAKSMGDKNLKDVDSFERFLKDRKAVDKRVDEVIEKERENVSSSTSWSSGEDIALLNALKAFPKDVAMRWEKVTAAVPGRSKAACMKRVGELKKDFRSSKGGGAVQG